MMQWLHVSLLSLLLIPAPHVQSCIEHEREALLQFKADVRDPGNQLASWSGEKCCNWAGIQCHNETGHVVRLDLRNHNYSSIEFEYYVNYGMSVKVSSSLIALSNLKYLDLSYNQFSGEIPDFIGLFEKLEYLNLSNSNFSGKVPPQLGNLSQLQYLDLSSEIPWVWTRDLIPSSDISWLSHLKSLRHLDMSFVQLHGSKEWAQSLNKLPSLEVLILKYNGLTYIPQSLSFVNFTSLRVLYLSEQNFNTTIPNWIFSLHRLTDLSLDDCGFVGSLPVAIGNLTSLRKLVLDGTSLYGKILPFYNLTKLTYLSLSDTLSSESFNITEISDRFMLGTWRRLEGLILSGCNLQGELVGWIGEMSSLKYLDLSSNNLSGPIPDDIGNLTNLVELDLSSNSFIGSLTDVHLDCLSKLEVLKMEGNPISFAMESNWHPAFQLHTLFVGSCKIGPKFPAWLQNQISIQIISLENTEIDDDLPDWLWSFASLYVLDLSNNKIRGKLPKSLKNLTKLIELNLGTNHFEGRIPSSFPDYLMNIDLSNNSLSGSIQFSLCRLTTLSGCDFSSNNLSGYLPTCSLPNLNVINIGNNKLSGTIPISLCRFSFLQVLLVKNNNLKGDFPTALQFCNKLIAVDIGENNFHGDVPEWVVESLPLLEYFSLRSNSFSGSIPSKLTLLNKLRILDLANNRFSGPIPTHLENLTMMAYQNSTDIYFGESWSTRMKGIDLVYISDDYSLGYIRSIDLSNNYLTGEIPKTIVALAGLMNLNLSRNHLVGKIPITIGMLKSLESLDLHMNNLSGTIPESLSALSFLEVLNLSYNNLSGSIPTGPQLQSLVDPSIYMGNPSLCGPPLETSCSGGGSSPDGDNNSNSTSKNSSEKEKLWFYLFIEFGFVTGFLVVIFILILKRNWRYAYFQWVDNKFDKMYVIGALILKKWVKESG